MSSDNTDRVIKDLKKAIDQLPSPAIGVVLSSWRRRIDDIKTQCNFVGNTPEVCRKEISVLENCIRDISAANLIEKGDSVGALKILLKE